MASAHCTTKSTDRVRAAACEPDTPRPLSRSASCRLTRDSRQRRPQPERDRGHRRDRRRENEHQSPSSADLVDARQIARRHPQERADADVRRQHAGRAGDGREGAASISS